MFRSTKKRKIVKRNIRSSRDDSDSDDGGGGNTPTSKIAGEREAPGSAGMEVEEADRVVIKSSINSSKKRSIKTKVNIIKQKRASSSGGSTRKANVVAISFEDASNDVDVNVDVDADADALEGDAKRNRSERKDRKRKKDKKDKKDKKSKRRKRGMGYGGMPSAESHDEDDDDDGHDDPGPRGGMAKRCIATGGSQESGTSKSNRTKTDGSDQGVEMNNKPASAYSKEAMQELMSEQRVRPKALPQQPRSQEEEMTRALQHDGIMVVDSENLASSRDANESTKDIIKETAVSNRSNTGIGNGSNNNNADSNNDGASKVYADSSQWEANIATRAGIRKSGANAKAVSQVSMDQQLVSLSTLRQQIQSTTEMLEHKEQELSSSFLRREAELVQAKTDGDKHKQSKASNFETHRFYQDLRSDLAMCIGALRDVEDRLKPIEGALFQMFEAEQDANFYQQWQDDVVAALVQQGSLGQILGRKVDPMLLKKEPPASVDEFGRDVQSQQSIQREQRHQSRVKSIQSWEQADVGVDATKIMDLLEKQTLGDVADRFSALQDALVLALDEVREEFVSKTKILTIFQRWVSNSKDEYVESFGYMSMAELLSVVVRIELIRSSCIAAIVKGDDEDDNNEAKHGPDTSNDSSPHNDVTSLLSTLDADLKVYNLTVTQQDENPVTVLIQKKSIVPFLIKAMAMPANRYLLSTKRSRHLSSLIHACASSLADPKPKEDAQTLDAQKEEGKDPVPEFTRLMDDVRSSVKSFVNSVAIPTLQKEANSTSAAGNSPAPDHARWFVAKLQSAFLQRLLQNLSKFWLPLFGGQRSTDEDAAVVIAVFGLISNYIQFLSTTMGRNDAKESFSALWRSLDTHCKHLLTSSAFMLHAAPIRASAIAYGLAKV